MSNEVSVVAPAAPAASASVSASAGSIATTRMGKMISDMVGGVPLGETETGSAWVVKALHPADTSVLTAPMPVNETRQFASVQYAQMQVESMPSSFNSALPWDMDIFVLRDPCLLYAYVKHQAGVAPVFGYRYSTQTGGASYWNAFTYMHRDVEKFRLTSHSVTAYFDAASTSDQGHIVCGQSEFPRVVCGAQTAPAVVDIRGTLPFTYWQDEPPTYDNVMQSTRSYQAPASKGVYAPSKLQNIGQWTCTNTPQALLGSCTNGSLSDFGRLGESVVEASDTYAKFYGTFPYLTMAAGDGMHCIYEQKDTSMTSIFMRGCAATSQWRVTIRWTLDCFVRPGTAYAPFVRMPPVEDHMAQKMYAEVSRRMPDAFPGDHNFLGALLPVIGKIAATVLPSIVPAIGNWLGGKQRERDERAAAGKLNKSAGFGEYAARALLSDKQENIPPESLGAYQRAVDLLGPLWKSARLTGVVGPTAGGKKKRGGRKKKAANPFSVAAIPPPRKKRARSGYASN